MPNIWSCDAEWFIKLRDEQPKVVVAMWSGDDERVNEWLEKLQAIEKEDVPVFVCDIQSCPAIGEKIGAKEGGETIIFKHGVETGRLAPGEDLETELAKVREMTG